MVQEKKKMQNLDEWQAIEKTEHPDAFAYPDFVETPEFSPSSNQKGEGQKRSTTTKFFDSPSGDRRAAQVDPAERCSAKATEPPTPRFGSAPWFGREDDPGDAPWYDAEAEAEDLIHSLGEGRVLGRMGGVCEEPTTWTYPHWPSWEPRDEDALHSLKF
ncbi:MAG: hypothetical protein VXU42_07110, partial [Verrucomicrobiota bacterium]|nr:hypothetical protein [Verrucomicrobiota bacterium]